MSDNAAPAKEKTKSKKMLVIIIGVVLLLVLGGGGAAFFLSKKAPPKDEDIAEEPVHTPEASPKSPPTFLPMDNMVVNLADPGGERFAQIGVTLEVVDAKTADQIKLYLPSIRSGILMVISQRTSTELLQREGKEKLAHDILREVSKPLGFPVYTPKKRASQDAEDEEDDRAARRRAEKNPVKRILFSSFIIQ